MLAALLVDGSRAHAETPRLHLDVGGSLAIGDPQGSEYGPGGEGRVGIEQPLFRWLGLQFEGGTLWLGHRNAPADPSIADHGDGSAAFAMGGLRLRSLAEVAGPWLDADAGYVRTGTLDRFGFDAQVGYDWRVGQGRWDVGPYVGYFQIFQPGDELRPGDGHVLSVGVHFALGAGRRAPPTVLPSGMAPPPRETVSRARVEPAADRDADGIADDQDACPDVAGVASDNPASNGCPPPSQVHVVENRIEYGKVVLFATESAVIAADTWQVLQQLADFINANPQFEEVKISGHADERGPEGYNRRLSQARADSVREILVRFGVDAARLSAQGFGDTRPRSQGHTEDDWRLNRRVEFIISRIRNAKESSATPRNDERGVRP